MKLAVLVIHRGDRPRFLQNLHRMIAAQTRFPDEIFFVDYEPLSGYCDITQRYRAGYKYLSEKGHDLIAIMEVDDWYAPDYLETMVAAWILSGKPDLFGIPYTIYYNLRVRGWFRFYHPLRASMMSTLIRPGLDIKWPVDTEPFTDTHLWINVKNIKKGNFTPLNYICLGIKHGDGMTGGKMHTDRLHRYKTEHNGNDDKDLSFLREHMDTESFDFYSTYFD